VSARVHGLPFFNAASATPPGSTPLHLAPERPIGPGHRVVFSAAMRRREVRQMKMPQHFAAASRRPSAGPAQPAVLRMNGEPMPQAHGKPVRLIAPLMHC